MNFRRYYIPNSQVFITNVVYARQPVFQSEQHLALLRTVLHTVKEHHPFNMLAYVFLPDHFHIVIRPTGQSNFSQIMQSLKRNFTQQYKESTGITGRMKFWQKRFHDHIIRDEADFRHHVDYIHYNPVQHGYVQRPEDWPHSSFRHWQTSGYYAEGWGWREPEIGVGWDEEKECGRPQNGECMAGP